MVIGKRFQKGIPLVKRFVILDKVIKIELVELGDYAVNIFPPHLGAFVDQVPVIWRNHDKRKIPDMVGKPLIFLFVQEESLSLVSFLDALDKLGIVPVTHERAVDCEIILVVADILGIAGIKVALAEGQVMDRIEKVGLSHPVIPCKTIDLVG
jgi:hypothetical protein